MATKLPYIVQPGSVSKILERVRQAETPDRFTQDSLGTKLGFKGGNYRQFIPLALGGHFKTGHQSTPQSRPPRAYDRDW